MHGLEFLECFYSIFLGKVTAVVTVMYLNRETKINLCSANLQKKRDTNKPRAAIGTQRETDSPRETIRVS